MPKVSAPNSAPTHPKTSQTSSRRLQSLDVLRGITIAGMIVVNTPSTWAHVYPPLRHAEWHGLTPTDLVFPFFLFMVGISITLALGKRTASGKSPSDIIAKIVKRSLIIFGLGIFLHGTLIDAFHVPVNAAGDTLRGAGYQGLVQLGLFGNSRRFFCQTFLPIFTLKY